MLSLVSLGLSPITVSKLAKQDFHKVADISHLKPTELSLATQLTLKESSEVLRLASSNVSLISNTSNLGELLQEDEAANHILSFCESIDNILDGGFHLRAVTEVFGTPGIGKTQLWCHSHLELLAVIKHLYTFLGEHKKVRLIIIDSVAFHFRHTFTDMMARTSLLCAVSQDLIQLASSHNLAVVVTNQMTTKIDSCGNGKIGPALGETWGHCPTIRLMLCWSGSFRMAKIIKAPHTSNSFVYFQITSGGVRGKEINLEKGEKRKLNQE